MFSTYIEDFQKRHGASLLFQLLVGFFECTQMTTDGILFHGDGRHFIITYSQ